MNEVWQDRIPPQNIEAEQAVLGSVFLDAETIIDAMEYIEPKDFIVVAIKLFLRQ